MLMTNLFSSRIARFLTLSIIVSSMVVVSGSFVTPTLSCPMEMPRPLLSLYNESASVVIARVGKSEVTKEVSNDENDDFKMAYVNTALHVSSTLKGEHKPVVYVNHYMFGESKDQLSSAGDDENLLVFLVPSNEEDVYYVDMKYGVKKLSDADLKVYVSRIEELASIMKSDEPSDTEIVEWLVRCAEKPATRWEGAYTLALSKYNRLMQEESADAFEPIDSSEAVLENEAAEPQSEETAPTVSEFKIIDREPAPTNANFLELLTTEQKYRLATALVNIDVITDKDYVLIEVVQTFDDSRLLPYLLAQLDLMSKPDRAEQWPEYMTTNIMTLVADKLGDDALKAMVQRFSGNDSEEAETYYDDEESSDESEEVAELSPEQEAAEAAATVKRRAAELQYFVTLALSTVPKTQTADNHIGIESPRP